MNATEHELRMRGVEASIAIFNKQQLEEALKACENRIASLDKKKAKPSVTTLIKKLKDDDYLVRMEAVDALVRIGNVQVVGALAKTLKDKKNIFRGNAATALAQIGGEQAFTALIETLGDNTWHASKSVAAALEQFSPDIIAQELQRMLNHKKSFVRRKAAAVIGYIADRPIQKLSDLAADDPDKDVGRVAHDAQRQLQRKLQYFDIPNPAHQRL
jgi:HEAT repeat protein